jgi:hypothetical protein
MRTRKRNGDGVGTRLAAESGRKLMDVQFLGHVMLVTARLHDEDCDT